MGTAWAMSGNQAAGGGGSGAMMSFLPMLIVMFVVMYFFLMRPQQKKQREMVKMLESLKKGDRVLTAGGIYGTVVGVADNIITVKIAENTKVEFKKSAIASVVESKGEAAA